MNACVVRGAEYFSTRGDRFNYNGTSGAGYVANTNDQVIKESSLTVNDVVLSLQQQSDGALLAWKAITVNA